MTLTICVSACVTNDCHIALNGSGNVFLDVDLLGSNDKSPKSEISR